MCGIQLGDDNMPLHKTDLVGMGWKLFACILLTDWMPARVGGEHFLEIRAANGQHNLVRMQQSAVTGQRDIHQIAALEQIMETGRDVFLRQKKPEERQHAISGCIRRFIQFSRFFRIFFAFPLTVR